MRPGGTNAPLVLQTLSRYPDPQLCAGTGGAGSLHIMEISDEQIEEFMAIWEQTYGETIPKEEALFHARQLLQLMKAVYQL